MKKYVFTLSFILLSTILFAQNKTLIKRQIKLYKTAQDFKNNIVTKTYTGYKIKIVNKLGKYSLALDNTKIEYEHYWGFTSQFQGEKYKNFRKLYRTGKKHPYLVTYPDGKIVIYTEYSSRYDSETGDLNFEQQPKVQMSLGLEGKMMDLDKNNLKKLVQGNSTALAELKKRKNLPQSLFTFIFRYNEGINSASFVEEGTRAGKSYSYNRPTVHKTETTSSGTYSKFEQGATAMNISVNFLKVSLNEYDTSSYIVLTDDDTIQVAIKKTYPYRKFFVGGDYQTKPKTAPKQFDLTSVKSYKLGHELYVAKTHKKSTSYMKYIQTVNGVNIYLTYGKVQSYFSGKTPAGFKYINNGTLPKFPIVLEKNNQLDMLTPKDLRKAKLISGINLVGTIAYEEFVWKLRTGQFTNKELEKIVSLHKGD